MRDLACPGPLVWFDAPPSPAEEEAGHQHAAILECAAPGCGYLLVTGSFHDVRHAEASLLREGLAQ